MDIQGICELCDFAGSKGTPDGVAVDAVDEDDGNVNGGGGAGNVDKGVGDDGKVVGVGGGNVVEPVGELVVNVDKGAHAPCATSSGA